MIKLERVRTRSAIPRSLRGNYLKKKLRLLIRQEIKYQSDQIDDRDFKTNYWKAAKNQLIAETHQKCAYCEADTRVVAHGDVEHYRPKSKYWWLAYCYDNFLFSCQICNQTYKGKEFPFSGHPFTGPDVAGLSENEIEDLILQIAPEPLDDDHDLKITGLENHHFAEDPHLINPYYSNPSDFFIWEALDIEQAVIIRNKPGVDNKYVKAAISYYGLNRDELKGLRFREYKKFEVFKLVSRNQALSAQEKQEVQNMLTSMMAPNAPFSGMLKYFDTVL